MISSRCMTPVSESFRVSVDRAHHVVRLQRILGGDNDRFADAELDVADLLFRDDPPGVIAVGEDHEHRGRSVVEQNFLRSGNGLDMAGHDASPRTTRSY